MRPQKQRPHYRFRVANPSLATTRTVEQGKLPPPPTTYEIIHRRCRTRGPRGNWEYSRFSGHKSRAGHPCDFPAGRALRGLTLYSISSGSSAPVQPDRQGLHFGFQSKYASISPYASHLGATPSPLAGTLSPRTGTAPPSFVRPCVCCSVRVP